MTNGGEIMTEHAAALGQVFTKRHVADYMAGLFTLPPGSLVLDPCFGGGVFLHSIAEKTALRAVGVELDTALFKAAQARFSGQARVSLCQGDFLTYRPEQLFDGVIMNPPYIRQEKIDALKPYGVTKARLRRTPLFRPLSGKANLYMYFILKAIDVLRPGGELIVIFPETWMRARTGRAFIRCMEQHCSAVKRVHVGKGAFEADALVDVVILKLQKNVGVDTCEEVRLAFQGGVPVEHAAAALPCAARRGVPLAHYAEVRRGLTTGANSFFVNPPLPPEQTREILSSPKAVRGYRTDPAQADRILLLTRADTPAPESERYLDGFKRSILKEKKPKTLFERIRAGDRHWYTLRDIDCRGILFGYIVRDTCKFIRNDANILVRDNFYVITPRSDASLLFALLNSYYTLIQLEERGKDYGAGLLKLQKYDLDALLLPDAGAMAEEDRARLRALGDALAETGDAQIIDRIGEVLARYEAMPAGEARALYFEKKKHRLGETK